MRRTDVIAYCQREAERLQSMLSRITTPAINERLLERIAELEHIVTDEAAQPPEFELMITKSRW